MEAGGVSAGQLQAALETGGRTRGASLNGETVLAPCGPIATDPKPSPPRGGTPREEVGWRGVPINTTSLSYVPGTSKSRKRATWDDCPLPPYRGSEERGSKSIVARPADRIAKQRHADMELIKKPEEEDEDPMSQASDINP